MAPGAVSGCRVGSPRRSRLMLRWPSPAVSMAVTSRTRGPPCLKPWRSCRYGATPHASLPCNQVFCEIPATLGPTMPSGLPRARTAVNQLLTNRRTRSPVFKSGPPWATAKRTHCYQRNSPSNATSSERCAHSSPEMMRSSHEPHRRNSSLAARSSSGSLCAVCASFPGAQSFSASDSFFERLTIFPWRHFVTRLET